MTSVAPVMYHGSIVEAHGRGGIINRTISGRYTILLEDGRCLVNVRPTSFTLIDETNDEMDERVID